MDHVSLFGSGLYLELPQLNLGESSSLLLTLLEVVFFLQYEIPFSALVFSSS